MGDAMIAAHIDRLQDMPIFGGLEASALGQLLEDAHLVAFNPADLLMVEGEAPGSVLVLVAGRVEVVKRVGEREFLLCLLGSGDCIGEMSWIDPCRRSATVRALTSCEAIRLEPRNFYQLRQTDLAQFSVLQMNIARELARRLRILEDRFFANLAQQS